MRQYILILFLTILLSSCEDTNVLVMTDAATDAVKAITLSDADVRNLAQRAAHESDSRHLIAPPGSSYDNRLRGLRADYSERDGYNLNFKVYLTEEVNAFAMADGTVRVYSGLMDLMSDEELLFVVGHEIQVP
jgi:putative metalloprotease